MRTGDALAESRTHADAVVGFVSLAEERVRDLFVEPTSTHFVVLEAKLGSGLAKGTRNVPWYDQATRNVACMAEALSDPRCAARPGAVSRPWASTSSRHASSWRLGVIDEHLREGRDPRESRAPSGVRRRDYDRWFESGSSRRSRRWTSARSAGKTSSMRFGADARRGQRPSLTSTSAASSTTGWMRRGAASRAECRSQAPTPAPTPETSWRPRLGRTRRWCAVSMAGPGGWIVVWHDLDTDEMQWEVVPGLTDLLSLVGGGRYGTPLTSRSASWTQAHACATARRRKRLPGRTSTVFTAPIRPILQKQTSYEAGQRRSGRAVDGQGHLQAGVGDRAEGPRGRTRPESGRAGSLRDIRA